MNNKPVVALSLCLVTLALHTLPDLYREFLFFDLGQTSRGNFIGLITGHWLHADLEHLIWNVSAFALLGGMLERESRLLLIASLIAGTLIVDLLLLSPLGEIDRYCGLSGVLNTVLACLLYSLWQRTRSFIVLLVGVLALLKIAIELSVQQSLFTNISWPPYAPAHLAGVLAAAIAIVVSRGLQRT